jgi:phosphoglycerate dehydrogenase-like enzyme
MTERSHVVVIGATPEDPPPGLEVVASVVDVSFAGTVEELTTALPKADVILVWRSDRELLSAAWPHAGSLKWIQSASAGVDGILFPELVDSHVVLTNAGGVFDTGVAEYVLGLMLVFAKDLVGVLDRQTRREWEPGDTETLEAKRLLIVGVGPIGRAVGRTAKACGMLVRGLGRTARPGDRIFASIFGADELEDALGWADYVVDALPATPATRHLFDAAAFGAMHPWARFINVGRGSTVEQDALIEALKSGGIAAAALDVFEDEPLPPASPLWDLPNVIVSPHVAGDTAGWRESVVELFIENLERYLTGDPLRNVVDKKLGFVP